MDVEREVYAHMVPWPPAGTQRNYAADRGLADMLRAGGVEVVSCGRLSRICFDSPDLLASLPEGLVSSLAAPGDVAASLLVQRSILDGLGGFERPRFPRAVAAPQRAQVSEAQRYASAAFASSFSSGPQGMLNIELLAAGRCDFTG